MLILLALTPALACSPEETDLIEVLPADGAADVARDAQLFVRLGDRQAQDPDLSLVLTDPDGEVVETAVDRGFSADALLEPGAYRLSVDSPATRDEPVDVDFTVGDDLAGAWPRPSATLVSIQDVEEPDPCFGTRRIMTATLDPAGDGTRGALLHVFTHPIDEPVSGTGPSTTVLMAQGGGNITQRFDARLPEDRDEITCVTLVVEGPDGAYSEASEPACGTPTTDPVPDDDPPSEGCACATSTSTAGAWLFLPLLLTLARRRR